MERRTKNEGERKEPPEMTIEEWYESKRYLRWPLIAMFLLVLLIVILFHFNII